MSNSYGKIKKGCALLLLGYISIVLLMGMNGAFHYGTWWEFGRYCMPRSLLAPDGYHYSDGAAINPFDLIPIRGDWEEEMWLMLMILVPFAICSMFIQPFRTKACAERDAKPQECVVLPMLQSSEATRKKASRWHAVWAWLVLWCKGVVFGMPIMAAITFVCREFETRDAKKKGAFGRGEYFNSVNIDWSSDPAESEVPQPPPRRTSAKPKQLRPHDRFRPLQRFMSPSQRRE